MRLVSSIDSYKVYTNEYGQRYSGIKDNKNLNKNTAMFFGDSFTFGTGTAWEKNFVGIVEKKLTDYNVFNFGVPSYSPSVHYYKLNQIKKNQHLFKIKNKPDKIFIQLDLTDVSDESERWTVTESSERPVLRKKDVQKKITKFKQFKVDHLKGSRLIANYLREFSRNVRKKIKTKLEKENEYKPVEGNSAGGYIYTNFNELTGCNKKEKKTIFWTCGGVDVGLKKIKEKIKDIGILSKEMNAELYIIIFPWPDTMNFGQTVFNWEKYTNGLCKISNCTAVINLFPEFTQIKEENSDWLKHLYLNNDIHLTPEANSIVAKKILNLAFNK